MPIIFKWFCYRCKKTKRMRVFRGEALCPVCRTPRKCVSGPVPDDPPVKRVFKRLQW